MVILFFIGVTLSYLELGSEHSPDRTKRIEELEVRGRPRNTRSPHGSTTVPSTNTSDEDVEEVIEGIRRGER